MNEIVKYDNYMNALKFTDFSSVDFNFLMVLCNKMRDKDTSKIVLSFDELKEKTNYASTSLERFVSDMKRMNRKLMRITCDFETADEIIMFVLFTTFEINLKKKTLTVSVNDRFKFILNELVKNFTRFELDEFITLESKYSKNLYRLLKQYRSTGRYEVSVQDFREKMDCPKAYKNNRLIDKIIHPAIKELGQFFNNLTCTQKYAREKGKPLTGYIFTFTPEAKRKAEKKQEKAESKAGSNRFNDYEQREYSALDIEKLEKAALKKLGKEVL